MSEPIVFVPGLLCTEALFASQIAAFSDRPIMVANHRDDDSIDTIAARLLNDAPERFSLISLSMGGYIAMSVMRQAPERVSRLALLNTNARADTQDQSERRRFLVDLARKKGLGKIPPLLYPGFVHERNEDNETLRAIVREMAMDCGADAFVRQQTAIIGRPDARPHLADIGCPTLVIAGDGDRLMSVDVAGEIHRLIPSSDLNVIENSGHLTPLETPETVTRLLRDFLNQA
ncbi:alpha/beta fold hydrolase [Rhodobacterales bacterium]|nr:alpha/beta fold hydrolase [Rhodobacterales bacterium]